MQLIWKSVVGILVCLLAGFLGSFATMPSIPTWYASLSKPSFNPPNWIFGPVWTTLYILMGIAAGIIWNKIKQEKTASHALIIFGLQLALNILWSFLFFGLHSPFYALVEIVFLWLSILATILAFWRISKPAAALLLPYICWVSFALFLNFTLYRMNP
jgi:tryptophan-rich sensory protein